MQHSKLPVDILLVPTARNSRYGESALVTRIPALAARSAGLSFRGGTAVIITIGLAWVHFIGSVRDRLVLLTTVCLLILVLEPNTPPAEVGLTGHDSSEVVDQMIALPDRQRGSAPPVSTQQTTTGTDGDVYGPVVPALPVTDPPQKAPQGAHPRAPASGQTTVTFTVSARTTLHLDETGVVTKAMTNTGHAPAPTDHFVVAHADGTFTPASSEEITLAFRARFGRASCVPGIWVSAQPGSPKA